MDKVIINLEKYRVTLSEDKKNYIIQEFRAGGFSRRTGVPAQPRWADIAYYGRFDHVIKGLIARNFEVPEGTLQNQLKDILVELRRVEKSLLEEMQKVIK